MLSVPVVLLDSSFSLFSSVYKWVLLWREFVRCVFFYTSWKNRIHFLSSSPCFPPPTLVRPGSVYCLAEYFMTRASHPQDLRLTLLLAEHMNKWEETTGAAGCLRACFPQQVDPYRSLPRASGLLVKVQVDRLCDEPGWAVHWSEPGGQTSQITSPSWSSLLRICCTLSCHTVWISKERCLLKNNLNSIWFMTFS